MFNPKKYIEEIIAVHLQEYVRSFDKSFLSLGIWNGDISLNKLILKEQQFPLGCGISLNLEYGYIESCKFKVPWTQLQSGELEVKAENLDIVLRLKMDEAVCNQWYNCPNAEKMNKVRAKERQLFDLPAEQFSLENKSWLDKAMNSFLESYFSKLAKGFLLSVKKLSVVLLIPIVSHSQKVEANSDYAAVRLFIDSIDISHGEKNASYHGRSSMLRRLCNSQSQALESLNDSVVDSEDDRKHEEFIPKVVFVRDVNIRGVTISVARLNQMKFTCSADYEQILPTYVPPVVNNKNSRKDEKVEEVHGPPLYGVFLNPTHTYINAAMYSFYEESSRAVGSDKEPISFSQKPSLALELGIGLNNFEISPSILELQTLRDSSTFLTIMKLRRQFAFLRPSVPKKGHAKEWWLFALGAVIGLIKESILKRENALNANELQNVDYYSTNTILLGIYKNKYCALYRMALEMKYKGIYLAVQGADISGYVDKYDKKSDIVKFLLKPSSCFLCDENALKLSDLERILSSNDIVTCRVAVHQIFSSTLGIHEDVLKALVCDVIVDSLTYQGILDEGTKFSSIDLFDEVEDFSQFEEISNLRIPEGRTGSIYSTPVGLGNKNSKFSSLKMGSLPSNTSLSSYTSNKIPSSVSSRASISTTRSQFRVESDAIDQEIIKLVKEFRSNDVSESVESSASGAQTGKDPQFYCHLELSVSRMSCCFVERIPPASMTHNRNKNPNRSGVLAYETSRTLIEMVVYEVCVDYETISHDESEVSLRVGCIKLYGNNYYDYHGYLRNTIGPNLDLNENMRSLPSNNVELFSCGSLTVDNDEEEDVTVTSKNRADSDLALVFILQSCYTPIQSERDIEPKNGDENDISEDNFVRRRHFVVEFSLATCHAYWDQPTMLFLRNLILSLLSIPHPSVDFITAKTFMKSKLMLAYVGMYQHYKEKFGYSNSNDSFRQFLGDGSVFYKNSSKYSVDIKLKGVVLNIPKETFIIEQNLSDALKKESSAVGGESPVPAEPIVENFSMDEVDSVSSSEVSEESLESDDEVVGNVNISNAPGRRATARGTFNTIKHRQQARHADGDTFFTPKPGDRKHHHVGYHKRRSGSFLSMFPRRRHNVQGGKHGNSIIFQLKIGLATLSSGDFFESYIAGCKYKRQVRLKGLFSEENSSKSQIFFSEMLSDQYSNSYMWTLADESVVKIVERTASPVIRSISYKVQDVEIKFVRRIADAQDLISSPMYVPSTDENSFETLQYLTRTPWCIKGLASQSELIYHPAFTDLRLDIFFSPLHISVSTQDMISIIDCTHSLEDIFKIPHYIEESIYHHTAHAIFSDVVGSGHRLNSLAPLSSFVMNAYFDDFYFALMEENSADAGADIVAIREVLSRYANELVNRNFSKSRSEKSYRRLAYYRLCYLASVEKTACELVLEELANSLQEKVTAAANLEEKRKLTEEVISLSVIDMANRIKQADVGNSFIRDRRVSISTLHIKGLYVNLRELTYDHKLCVAMKEFRLLDRFRNPMILIHNKHKRNEVETPSSKVDQSSPLKSSLHSKNKGKSSGSKVDEVEIAYTNPSLVLNYTECTAGYDYGKGGLLEKDILRSGGKLNQEFTRIGSANISIAFIDSHMSRDGVPSIVEQVLPAISRVKKHYVIVAYTHHRHQQLLSNKKYIPQLGYSNIFDVETMQYIDVMSLYSTPDQSKTKSSKRHRRKPGNRSHEPKFRDLTPINMAEISEPVVDELKNSHESKKLVLSSTYEIKSVILLLGDKDNLLCECTLTNVSLERRGIENKDFVSVNYVKSDKTNIENCRYMLVSAESVRVFDLSINGGLHSQVAWSATKHGGDSLEELFEDDKVDGESKPAVELELISVEDWIGYFRRQNAAGLTHVNSTMSNFTTNNSDTDQKQELINLSKATNYLTLRGYGISVCFLYRHYQELIVFIFEKMYNPIVAAFDEMSTEAKNNDNVISSILDSEILGMEDIREAIESDGENEDGEADDNAVDEDSSSYSEYSDEDPDIYNSSTGSFISTPVPNLQNSTINTPFRTPVNNTPFASHGKYSSAKSYVPFHSVAKIQGLEGSNHRGFSPKRSSLGSKNSSYFEDSPNVIDYELSAVNVFESEWKYDYSFYNFSVVFPRNSVNEDLIGLTCSYFQLTYYPMETSWSGITSRKSTGAQNVGEDEEVFIPMHFNLAENDWSFNADKEKEYLDCNRYCTSNSALLYEREKKTSDRRIGFERETTARSFTPIFSDSAPTPLRSQKLSTLFSAVDEEKSDDGLSFYDAKDIPGRTSEKSPLPGSLFDTPLSRSPKKDISEYYPYVPLVKKSNYLRYLFSFKDVMLYACLFSPLKTSKSTPDGSAVLFADSVAPNVDETRKFATIRPMHSVYHMRKIRKAEQFGGKKRSSTGTASVAMSGSTFHSKWRQISETAFDLNFLIDAGDVYSRILISDTAKYTPIALRLTMGEFYLLMSVWYDNFYEFPQFFPVTCRSSPLPVEIPPDYGSADYIKHLQKGLKFDETGFIMVCANLSITLSMDVNYFPDVLPSMPYFLRDCGNVQLSEMLNASFAYVNSLDRQNHWMYQSIPVVSATVQRFVVHSQYDGDIVRTGVGADCVTIIDIRTPAQTCQPLVIQLLPSQSSSANNGLRRGKIAPRFSNFGQPLRSTVVEETNNGPNNQIETVETLGYGYVDFQFGLSHLPSHIALNEMPKDVSLLLTSYYCSSSCWTTTNILLNKPDLQLFNMDMIWFLSDIFSLYFRLPEYGHPGVVAYNSLPADLRPYSGTDTRLFASRPHGIIMANPLRINSASLHVETDNGIYYRHTLDSNGSSNIEVNVTDLAIVLMDSYKPHFLARGVRGASGSGRGLRTQLEFLTGAFIYSYDAISQHADILVQIEPFDGRHRNAYDKDEIVSWDTEVLVVHPVPIQTPTSVFPLSSSDRSFTDNSCDVVTSYEDILLATSLFKPFADFSLPKVPSVGKVTVGYSAQKKEKEIEVKQETTNDSRTESVDNKLTIKSSYMVVRLRGIRAIIVDNVLGLHLPLVQFFADEIDFTSDKRIPQHEDMPSNESDTFMRTRGRSNSVTKTLRQYAAKQKMIDEFLADNPNIYVCYCTGRFWADYFSNVLKCWECLFEPVTPIVIYEESPERGVGWTVRLGSTIHVNLTGALLRAVNDILRMAQSTRENMARMQEEKAASRLSVFQPSAHERENGGSNMKINRGKSHLRSRVKRGSTFMLDEESARVMHLQLLNDISGVNSGINHIKEIPLRSSDRVGFSILNLTGQSIRYFQAGDDGKHSVHYLSNEQRGSLNFVASTTLIRNNLIFEEEFTVQRANSVNSSRNARMVRVGHQVPLQLSGYKWLPAVQADTLGVRFEDLSTVLGRISLSGAISGKDRNDVMIRIANATKLVTEVSPYNGGRLLTLKSTFCLQNNTTHPLNIVLRPCEAINKSNNRNSILRSNDVTDESFHQVFQLDSGESLSVPISLLHESAVISNGSSLGMVFIKPWDILPVKAELAGKHYMQPWMVSYTVEPIDLLGIVTASEEAMKRLWLNKEENVAENASAALRMNQLCCHVSPKPKGKKSDDTTTSSVDFDATPEKGMSGRLPPFCYTTEIKRVISGNSSMYEVDSKKKDGNISKLASNFTDRFFNSKDRAAVLMSEAAHYTVVIHPPIMLENLLPSGGKFTLIHAIHKTVLWSGWIGAGMVQPVHTVTLDEPLLLLVNLRYCRSTEGILVHKPTKMSSAALGGFAEAVKSTIEGFLEEEDGGDASIFLTDTVGQRLRLHLQNTLGGGGQRHILIYCPYWLVNTSQYSIRVREDGELALPAGSVTVQKNGTRLVADADFERSGHQMYSIKDAVKAEEHEVGENTVYPGQMGPLHSSTVGEISEDAPLRKLLRSLAFEDVVDMAYMFNYKEDNSVLGSKRTVKLQMDDSDWSYPFSLDTAGVTQSIVVENVTHGSMEVGLKVDYAPGKLSKLTKIVRFSPKFVMLNKIDSKVELIQAAGVGAGEVSSVQVSPGHLKLFNLPAVYGERVVSLQVAGPWKSSAPFLIDHIGTYTINIPRKLNLNAISHVQTRGLPEYTVTFPSKMEAEEIGIWFETDWTFNNVVVKAIKNGLFAAIQTDIQVGDVLLEIDGETVRGKDFGAILEEIKTKREEDGVTVRFRTVEEKLRLIRTSALVEFQKTQNALSRQHLGNVSMSDVQSLTRSTTMSASVNDHIMTTPIRNTLTGESLDSTLLGELSQFSMLAEAEEETDKSLAVKVDLRASEATVFLYLSTVDVTNRSDYRIENNSASHVIHYKQKGVPGIRWAELLPGKSAPYVWEDPFKPHRLIVRAGRNILDPNDGGGMHSTLSRWNNIGGLLVKPIMIAGSGNLDHNVVVMHFDELNKDEILPLNGKDASSALHMVVMSDGPTKVLKIGPPENHMKFEHAFVTDVITEQLMALHKAKGDLEICCKAFEMGTPINIDDNFSVPDKKGLVVMRRRSGSPQSANITIASQLQMLLKDLRDGLDRCLFRDTTIRKDSSLHERRERYDGKMPKLCSSFNYDSPLGLIIDQKHRVKVEVFEARELRSTKQIKGDRVEDIFCKVYLKTPSDVMYRSGTRQRQYSYICDQTMDPLWVGQKFLFEVPETAATDGNRGFFVRVVLYCTTFFGYTKFMGQTDVPFSGLQSERVLKGWFPLQGKESSNISALPQSTINREGYGSIKLKIQWVFTDFGLIQSVYDEVIERSNVLNNLEKSREHMHHDVNFFDAVKEDELMLHKPRRTSKIHKSAISQLLPQSPDRMLSDLSVEGLEVETAPTIDINLMQANDGPPGSLKSMNTTPKTYTLSSFPKSNNKSNKKPGENRKSGVTVADMGLSDLFGFDGEKKFVNLDHVYIPKRFSSHHCSTLDWASQVMIDKAFLAFPLSGQLRMTNNVRHNTESPVGIEVNKHKGVIFFEELSNRIVSAGMNSTNDGKSLALTSILTGKVSNAESGLPSNLLPALRRRETVFNDNEGFLDKVEEECFRSFYHVHAALGDLEITPIQALQLPESKYPLHVRIVYGDEHYNSHSIPPAADLTWIHVDSMTANGTEQSDSHTATHVDATTDSLRKVIHLDLLNVKGTIKVKIMAEVFPSYKEIAVVDIPVFNLLDCICMQEATTAYDRWFPLLLSSECVPSEGQQINFHSNIKPENIHYTPFGYQPCIHLQFRWRAKGYPPLYSKFYARLQLPNVSVAVVDSVNARELLQLTVSDITMRQYITKEVTDTSANVGYLQIDNQLQMPLAPVILYPTQVKFPRPVIRLHMRRSNINSHPHLNAYEAIQIVVQELDMRLEQQTVIASWVLAQDWIKEIKQSYVLLGAEKSSKKDDKLSKKSQLSLWYGLNYVPSINHVRESSRIIEDKEEDKALTKIYIETFKLGPIKINVSFLMSPNLDSTVVESGGSSGGRSNAANEAAAEERSDRSQMGAGVINFFWQVGEVVLDLTSAVDNAPIMLNGLFVPNLFETEAKLYSILQGHYLTSALTQLYKIVGSLELVGNPIGLMSSLGIGVRDFFYEPGLALINSPTEFGKIGKGVVKGTLSLMTNTADGMIGTGTTITRSAGRGLAKLAVDNAFLTARQDLQRMPIDAASHILRPVKDIGNGFYYGVVGVVRVPYASIKRFGISGIFSGIAMGLAGVAAKPVVGVLDAITHTGESCRELMKHIQRDSNIPITRRRLSNMFGPDGRILPYCFATALGFYILKLLDQSAKEKFTSGVTNAVSEGIGIVRSVITGLTPGSGHRRVSGSYDALHHSHMRRSSKTIVRESKNESSNEFVIFAALLRKGVSFDQIVIISNLRLVVADYRREHGGSFIKLVWQSNLISIRQPTLERNGGGATLTISSMEEKKGNVVTVGIRRRRSSLTNLTGRGTDFKSKRSSLLGSAPENTDNDFTIIATYQEENILVQICNCLNVMVKNFEGLIPSNNMEEVFSGNNVSVADLEEDEYGVVRVGPWEYSRQMQDIDNSVSTEFNNPLLSNALEEADWFVHSRTEKEKFASINNQNGDSEKSQWLLRMNSNSEDAHRHIGELTRIIDSNTISHATTVISSLMNGKLSYSEFLSFFEAEVALAEKLKAESAANQTVGDEHKNDDSSSVDTRESKGKFKVPFLKSVNSLLFSKDKEKKRSSTKVDKFIIDTTSVGADDDSIVKGTGPAEIKNPKGGGLSALFSIAEDKDAKTKSLPLGSKNSPGLSFLKLQGSPFQSVRKRLESDSNDLGKDAIELMPLDKPDNSALNNIDNKDIPTVNDESNLSPDNASISSSGGGSTLLSFFGGHGGIMKGLSSRSSYVGVPDKESVESDSVSQLKKTRSSSILFTDSVRRKPPISPAEKSLSPGDKSVQSSSSGESKESDSNVGIASLLNTALPKDASMQMVLDRLHSLEKMLSGALVSQQPTGGESEQPRSRNFSVDFVDNSSNKEVIREDSEAVNGLLSLKHSLSSIPIATPLPSVLTPYGSPDVVCNPDVVPEDDPTPKTGSYRSRSGSLSNIAIVVSSDSPPPAPSPIKELPSVRSDDSLNNASLDSTLLGENIQGGSFYDNVDVDISVDDMSTVTDPLSGSLKSSDPNPIPIKFSPPKFSSEPLKSSSLYKEVNVYSDDESYDDDNSGPDDN